MVPLMVDIAPLHLEASATAPNVARLRRALRQWLAQALRDEDAVEDLTLAASEALENVVDHAFVGRDEPGIMTLNARSVRAGAGHGLDVTIVVTDDGHWQPRTEPRYRGRGLALIDELVGTHRLRTTSGGTTVTLHHHQ